ncbi:hypothetical protein LguiA_034996 [Lonicera macranthoides]
MLLLLFFTFLFTFLPTETPDLTSDRATLLVLHLVIGGCISSRTSPSKSPYQWAGVQCHNNHVIALCLPGVSLSGQLPFSTVRNFIDLQTLSLCFNALSRPLPPISQIVSLKSMLMDSFLGNVMCGKPLKSCPIDAAIAGIEKVGNNNKKKKWLSGGAIAVIATLAEVIHTLKGSKQMCGPYGKNGERSRGSKRNNQFQANINDNHY